MSMASPEIQDLSRRLLAIEAARDNSSGADAEVAMRVVKELRLRLIRLAGVDGFHSLLSRALSLAKEEVPALKMVQVRRDGTLEGFDGIEGSGVTATAGAAAGQQAGTILVAHLLELLMTFVGEPLTLRLVRDMWPDASQDKSESEN